MPVRIGLRIAQFRGDAIFQTLRNEMFQPFRFLVDLVPRIVQEIVEEALQQTMMAKNLQRAHLSRRRQKHAMMLLVFHKRGLLRRELLKHPGDGCRAHAKMKSQSVAGDTFFFDASDFVDSFEIIVYRFRSVRTVDSRYH